MLIPTNQTLLTVLLDCTPGDARLTFTQRDDAEVDIPMIVSRDKCNQSDFFTFLNTGAGIIAIPIKKTYFTINC